MQFMALKLINKYKISNYIKDSTRECIFVQFVIFSCLDTLCFFMLQYLIIYTILVVLLYHLQTIMVYKLLVNSYSFIALFFIATELYSFLEYDSLLYHYQHNLLFVNCVIIDAFLFFLFVVEFVFIVNFFIIGNTRFYKH